MILAPGKHATVPREEEAPAWAAAALKTAVTLVEARGSEQEARRSYSYL